MYFQPSHFYNVIETTRIGAGLSRALLRATIWRSSAQRLVKSPGRSTCPTLHPVLRSLKQRYSLRYFGYSLTKSFRKLSTAHERRKFSFSIYFLIVSFSQIIFYPVETFIFRGICKSFEFSEYVDKIVRIFAPILYYDFWHNF